ncbi:MAG TPA: glycine zipper 2TM domain-containing protein [Xylella taiwanensis]
MNNQTRIVLIALGALLLGGVATAAFMNIRGHDVGYMVNGHSDSRTGFEYADVIHVDTITEKKTVYGQVVSVDPIRDTTTMTAPREICRDVMVQQRLPERDGNVGGTAVGLLIGGLVGNQFGHGNGRKALTAAGAVAGGFIGNEVDREHVGGRVVERTERRCHSENSMVQTSHVSGYSVTYRKDDGTTGTLRMSSKPGDRVELGQADNVVGYDVTYRYDGQEKTVRLNEKPIGNHLPLVDGQLVNQTTATTSHSVNL